MDELRIEQRGHARWLILNRPERRNALSRDLLRALHGAISAAASYGDVRSIVLAGAGPVFCAGADLSEFQQIDDPALVAADGEILSRLLATIAESPKPVIARVHGAALGGAVGLVAAADLAIADSTAVFGLSEVRLGLVPAVISPFVVRALGRRAAQALMLTGQRIHATEACRIGLIQRVVEPNELDAAVDELVEQLLHGAPGALADVKRLLDVIEGRSLDDARDLTTQILADRRLSDEGQEGMKAFLDKRSAAWAPNQ
jgi:methylglutaconyl-CoA hydratase